jgi:hypothetical protein
MTLSGVSSSDTEVQVSIALDKAATGGGTYLTVRPRQVTTSDYYFVDAHHQSTGAVRLILGRTAGGAETALRAVTVPGLSVSPGDQLRMRVQAVGTSPTTLQAKLWHVGDAEPASWTVSTTDSSTSLQAAGALGLRTYLSGSATNAPQVASFDDLWAGPTG